MVMDEIQLATDITPRQARWTRRTEATAHATEGEMVIYIMQGFLPPPSHFRVFGRQAILRPVRKSTPSDRSCSNCHQYHNNRNCRRLARCAWYSKSHHNTSDLTHTPQPCMQLARCINCRGLYTALKPDCPARPRRDHGVIHRPDRCQL